MPGSQSTAARLFDLSGRVAVVTGAASGLGRAIALGLAQHGADVALADVDEVGLAETVEMLAPTGRRTLAVRCDVASAEETSQLFDRVETELRQVDILVNDAFTPVFEKPEALSRELWDRAVAVNLTGYFHCAQAAGRKMIARGQGGAIVNIGSIAGTSALGGGAFVYSITKGGVVQMTKELAVEWGRYGIRVNAIQPCQFRTKALRDRLDAGDAEALMKRMVSAIPLGRIGEPGPDIVGPVVFLVSDAARMVTGVVLPVDGGNLALNAFGVTG